MRLRDRRRADRLDPRIERELAAVDACLAGREVSDDLAGIAEVSALATEERPAIDAEFAALLDERAAAGFPRGDRAGSGAAGVLDRLRAAPPRRLIAPAAAAATLLVVVGVAITAIGGFGGGGSSSSSLSSAPSGRSSSSSVSRAPSAAPTSRGPAAGGLEDAGPIEPRRVSRSANLTLSTDPDKVRAVADGITQVTRRWHGLVISSQITSGKGSPHAPPAPDVVPVNPSLGAEFKLRIPASKLEPALDDLSSLALVTSRSEGSQDVTGRFNSTRQRIGNLFTEREALIKHLAGATTPAAVHAIKHRLAVVRHQLGRAQGELDQLRERVSMVPVQVSVVARGEGVGGGGFGVGPALGDAGRVLTVAAGVLLIGLAVLAPLALLAALAWLSARALARWRRERALEEHGI
jgi:uncharacterized protein DUF4349